MGGAIDMSFGNKIFASGPKVADWQYVGVDNFTR